jgi:hypothetical protein
MAAVAGRPTLWRWSPGPLNMSTRLTTLAASSNPSVSMPQAAVTTR